MIKGAPLGAPLVLHCFAVEFAEVNDVFRLHCHLPYPFDTDNLVGLHADFIEIIPKEVDVIKVVIVYITCLGDLGA